MQITIKKNKNLDKLNEYTNEKNERNYEPKQYIFFFHQNFPKNPHPTPTSNERVVWDRVFKTRGRFIT